MQKIRKGDEVQIVRGSDRPQTAEDKAKPSGSVTAVNTVLGLCKVSGRRLVWKHKKGTSPENPGGRSQQEAWIPLANVMVFNKASGKPERIVFKTVGGRRVRTFRKSGTPVDAK